MQKKSTRYIFSNVIEYLKQNFRKQIDYKKPANAKHMNRVQSIRIKVWKCTAVGCTRKVNTFSFCFYLLALS